jgi:hypothetical protein
MKFLIMIAAACILVACEDSPQMIEYERKYRELTDTEIIHKMKECEGNGLAGELVYRWPESKERPYRVICVSRKIIVEK